MYSLKVIPKCPTIWSCSIYSLLRKSWLNASVPFYPAFRFTPLYPIQAIYYMFAVTVHEFEIWGQPLTIVRSSPEGPFEYRLMTTFPNRELVDDSLTIEEAVNPRVLHACIRWKLYLSVLRYEVVRFIPCFVRVGWMQVYRFTTPPILTRNNIVYTRWSLVLVAANGQDWFYCK